MKFSVYDSYKATGLSWLGDVPTHWRVQSLKSILAERNEKNDPVKSDNILSLTMDRGVIPYSERGGGGNKAKEDLTAYKLAYPNDIVLNSMNVIAGSVGLSKYFGAVSPVYYMLYPRYEVDHIRYFAQIFQAETFQKSLYGLGNGILVKESGTSGKLNTIRMRIPMKRLNAVALPYPSPDEQLAISSFLDVETSKIDSLVLATRRLTESLKEKRQAVISHAVTKGVDRSAPMKDSGIEWLGDIPVHWGVAKSRRLFEIVKQIAGELGHQVLSITQRGITVKDLKSNEGQLSMDYSKYQFVRPDDFAMNHMDLLTGYVDIAQVSGVTSPDYRVFRLRDPSKYFAPYYLKVFQMGYHQKILFAFGQGSAQLGRWRLPTKQFKGLPLPVPPLDEQIEIVRHIENLLQKIDALILKSEDAIGLLRERRTALISAAITGKIDVRNHELRRTA